MYRIFRWKHYFGPQLFLFVHKCNVYQAPHQLTNSFFKLIFEISGEAKKDSVLDLSGRMIKMKLDPTSVQGNILHKSLKQDSIPVKCVLPTRPP